jgi:N-acetyl-ornithine/N-acetyl-lysine deacetylase
MMGQCLTLADHQAISWTPADEEALLVSMLAHYTPSGSERPLAEWLRDRLIPLGFAAEVDAAGNLVAQLPPYPQTPASAPEHGDTAGSEIVLLGHLDTVPGYIPVRREGDRLYGRGAVDAKGPLAAFLAAATRLLVRQVPRRRPLVVVGTVEEEAATSRGARAVLDRWRPAYAIIGEPSGVAAITLGYKGRLLVQCRIERPTAHTARPEDGVCARGFAFWMALCAAADVWNRSYARSLSSPHTVKPRSGDKAGPHFTTLTPALRAVRSGSDGFTDWCELEVGYRLPPDFDIAALEHWLAEEARRNGGQITFRGAEPAYMVPRRGPLVSAFVRALRAEGLEPAFKYKTGTSDMNVVGPVWNCPILAYGPGNATLDHTPHEHLLLADYHRGIAVLERVLTELISGSPAQSASEATTANQPSGTDALIGCDSPGNPWRDERNREDN